MAAPPVPGPDSSSPSLDEVIDLATGRTAGWMLDRRSTSTGIDAVTTALSRRDRLPAGQFLGVMLPGADAVQASLRLDAGRLDGLAVLIEGPIDRDGLTVLERARERGAVVGCDSTAALVYFGALTPDLLALSAAEASPAGDDDAGAAAVRALVTIADDVGARVLAPHAVPVERMLRLRELGVALARRGSPGRRFPSVGLPPNVTTASFRRVKRAWRQPLELRRPALPATCSPSELLELCLEHSDHDWIVLVDDRSRPVCLVDRTALLCGEPFEHEPVRVGPGTSLRDAADAAADRPEDDRSLPLVACDFAGRYRGVLLTGRRARGVPLA